MVGLAQIGCGYWGPNLLRAFSRVKECRIKWVVEASESRRAYVEDNFPGITATADWISCLNDSEVQGVLIATPASTHHALVKAAIESGKHVFVEKPLALTTRHAEELGALASTQQRILMVGHTFLYNGAVRHVRELLRQKQLGEVYYIYCQRLNLGQVRSDVNAWWNLAPHDVSILLYLLEGELPVKVAAQGASYLQPGIEDVVFATLTWASGVTAHLHVSWLDPGKVRRVVLVGSRKMVVCDDVSEDKVTVFDKGFDRVPRVGERMDFDAPDSSRLLHRTGDVWLPKVSLEEPLKVEAEHFIQCMRTGQTPLTGPAHARDVVAVLEAGQRSLRAGGLVTPVEK